MDDTSTTAATFDQADEEMILTTAVSDEALEAAAGTGGRALTAAWTLDCGTCSPAAC